MHLTVIKFIAIEKGILNEHFQKIYCYIDLFE